MPLPEALPPLLAAIPLLFPLVAAAEGAWLSRHGGYDWRAYWASLGDALGRGLLNAALQGGLVALAFSAVAQWRIADIAMDRAWHWLLLFLGVEAAYYAMHRASHRVRWLWLNHAVHHSPRQYALSGAYRLGWTGQFTGAALAFAPLVWLGFPVQAVVGLVALNLVYQFWLHTELVGTLPRWIEWTFNTPAHHRVHHASNADYLDCNYGGVLMVFDRCFGTFRRAHDGVPIRYGLVEPVHGYNPVWIALHAWVRLARDLRSARGVAQRVRLVLGPPGGVAAPSHGAHAGRVRREGVAAVRTPRPAPSPRH